MSTQLRHQQGLQSQGAAHSGGGRWRLGPEYCTELPALPQDKARDAVLGTYQFPPLLRDGADIHRVALNHIQEAYLRDCDGADHMNPPDGRDRSQVHCCWSQAVPKGQ